MLRQVRFQSATHAQRRDSQPSQRRYGIAVHDGPAAVVHDATASFSTSGTLTAAADLYLDAAASFTVTTDLTAAVTLDNAATASFSTSGTLTAAADLILGASCGITVTSDLVAVATLDCAASADLTVTADLVAAADLLPAGGGTTHDATADLTITADLTAAATLIEPEPTGFSGGWAPTRIIPRPVVHQATAAAHIHATLVADADLDPAGQLRRLLEDELVLLELI